MRARWAKGGRFPLLVVAALLLLLVAEPAIERRSEASAGRNTGAEADRYGSVPLSFEPNRGQSDPRVRFLSRGDG
jgi:hypothetical protein